MSTSGEECDDTMASADVTLIQAGEKNTLDYTLPLSYEEIESEDSQSENIDEENTEACQNEEEENAIHREIEQNTTLKKVKVEEDSPFEEDKMEDNSTLEEDKLDDNTLFDEDTLYGPSRFDEEFITDEDLKGDLLLSPLSSEPTSSMGDKEEEFVNRSEGEIETKNVEEKSNTTIQRVERSSIREHNQESMGDANSGIERREHESQRLHLSIDKNTITPVNASCLQFPSCTSSSNFDSNSNVSRKNNDDCKQTTLSLPSPATHQQSSGMKPGEQESIPTCRHEDQKTFPSQTLSSTSVLDGFAKQGSEQVVETKQCDQRCLTDDDDPSRSDVDGFGKQGIKAMVETEPRDYERRCTRDDNTSQSNLDVHKEQKSDYESLPKTETSHSNSSFGKDDNKAELLLGDCEKSESKSEAKVITEKDVQDSKENRPTLHVHQHEPNNKFALHVGDHLKSILNLPENTEVKVFTKIKSGKKRSKKSKTRICVTIEDEEDAENATFVTINKKYCRDILDRFFQGMNIILEVILPGSIILEIKPTSEGSIKSLLKSVKDGSLNMVVKQILEQESVFKHIKGKKVTVNLEITIPEDLLEEEGIIILENTEMELDEKSKISVTVKEQDGETVSDDESDDGVEDDDGDHFDADAEDDDGVSDADFKDAADNDDEDDAYDDADLKKDESSTSDQAGKHGKSGDVIGTTLLTSSLTEACVALPEKPSTSKDFSVEMKEPHSKRCMEKLTLSSLHDMLDWDPSEILLTFKKNLRSLRQILNHSQLKAKTIQSLIVLLGKMSTTSMTEYVNEILLVVLQSKFFEGYLSEFILNMDDSDAKLSDTLKFVLKISREILNKMPTDGFNKVQQITYLVQGKWSRSELSDLELSKDIDTLLSFLKMTKSQREKQKRRTTEVEDYSIPVESFRDLPITAKKSELDGTEEVLVLPNKIGSGFVNLEHYLECQFRLFRADVILPLKQNIEDFKRADMSMTTSFRAYKQVKILRPMCLDNGIGYRLAFDPKPFRNVKWERSQRLIFGSLLLLSSDGFTDDFMFATVDTREPAMLQKGLVDVQFVTDIEFAALPRGQVFDMVESQAYFESYKDVLKGMQEVTDKTFPFKEYIVECRNIGQEPMYLKENKSFLYDLRPLVDDSVKITATAKDDTKAAFSQESEFAEKIRIQYKESWPSIDNLDDSQVTALQNALTREFALIQGPPGTGKTYVGIKILKVLLHNQAVWMDQGGQVPILVVCYTNHALDQFLEGVLDMFDGRLIRVGGRIKSERLQKYSLRDARQRIKDKKEVPSHLFETKIKTIRTLKKLRKQMEKSARKIEAAEREIIHESHLTEFMLKKHATEFMKSGVGRLTIGEWLGIESKLFRIDHVSENSEDEFEDVVNGDSDEEDGDGGYESSESRQSRRQLEEDTMDDFGEPYDHVESEEEEEEKDLIAVDVTNLDNYKEQKFLSKLERQLSRDKAKKRRKFKNQLMNQISSNDMIGPEEQKQIKHIRKMSAKDRWRLYRFWVDKLSLKARTDIKTFEEDYKRVSLKFKKILMEVDKIILKNCSVIGMTTTGAARYQRILNEIGPKIILVEEAAEVLEAHIVGSLSKRCQHLILIGDHKQLRPNPTVHSLAKKYNLEISLFERMVKSGIRCDMLQWQHRMRPEIADVIRPIYDNLLKDHPMVQSYDNVRGVAKNIFFVDHQNDHSFDEETKSFRNVHEALYLSALYRYLIKQGYKQTQITVLTFYSAQIDCLNRLIQISEFKGRRICAVDGYQGEENDIILLSLVRSKKEGTIGFLKEENRICVALSRAKIGMYVIGNFTHLAENSNLLETICKGAYKQSKIAPTLPLCCPRHLDNVRVEALTPEDFTAAPEGGCQRQCDYRLPCGHVCTKVCHAGEHTFEQCFKPCKKCCRNGHQTCKKLCYEECSPCQETLETKLKCGHVQNVPCCKDSMTFSCKEKCQDNLECGHSCPGLCGAPHPPCTVAVDADLPCGHHVKTTCGQKDDPSSCNAPCSSLLECGHACQGSCGSCYQGRLHQPCTAKCMNILICGHKCESTCNNCPPCERDCERKCSHRKCNKKCREPCTPCNRPCDSKCRHMECKLECNQKCQRERCNDKCRKKLECKHPCAGICGEPCPELCGTCNKTKFDETVSSTEGTAPSKPRLILLEDCGCIFEATFLDKFMDKTKEAEGHFGLIECPKCHSPIRQSNRYGAIVKETLEDVEKAKIKVINSDRRRQLKQTLEDLSARFKAPYKVTVDKIRKSSTDESEESLAAKLTQLQLLKKVASLEEIINRSLSIQSGGSVKVLLHELASFKTWISSERTVFSRQEIRDSSREVTRLSCFFYCLAGLKSDGDFTENFKGRLRAWISRLEMSSVLTEEEIVQLRTLKEELIQKIPTLRVRACEEEQMIIKSPVYNFNRNTWHKCKKGHVFAKAQSVSSKSDLVCPECGGNEGAGMTPLWMGDNSLTEASETVEASGWTEEMDRELAMSLDKELNG